MMSGSLMVATEPVQARSRWCFVSVWERALKAAAAAGAGMAGMAGVVIVVWRERGAGCVAFRFGDAKTAVFSFFSFFFFWVRWVVQLHATNPLLYFLPIGIE